MKLTICLVTKGRDVFLSEALRSYEPFLATGLVDVILIDNGSEDNSKKILMDWKSRFPNLVKYVRIDKKEPLGTPFFWGKIKYFSPDWIVFPGDDDLLVFDIFDRFMVALKNKPEISIYASSAEIINVDGGKSGLIRKPAIHGLTSKIEQLAKSLHEPPFLWPGLFFKFDLIKQDVPQSRFVFDWWVGLQLVMRGNVLTASEVGIKYRVHNLQESNQAPSQRKYFEGFFMLTKLINSNEFLQTFESIPHLEIIKFLELSFAEKPLYSQPEYYNSLLNDLVQSSLPFIESSNRRTEVLEKYLFASGVLLKRNDIDHVGINFNQKFGESRGNIAINFVKNTCTELIKSNTLFSQNSANKFTISCKHSKRSPDDIHVNCDGLAKLSIDEVADSILIALNEHLVNNGYLPFSTTPFEKSVIVRFRRLKLKMPKIILKNSAFIKKLVGDIS